jgi:thioredoxin-like negative regulator of GroEL
MSEVKNIDSQEAYEALKGAESKICLFFWADWHAPSQEGGQMHDVLQTLAKKYKDICFARVNAEELPEVATEYNVTVVPTMVCVGGGKTVGQVAGANPPELSKLVRAFNTSKSAGTAATSVFKADPVAALNARLKALIATAPVMLFMKVRRGRQK